MDQSASTPRPKRRRLQIRIIESNVDEQKAHDWYETWRTRIKAWVGKHTDHQFADLLLLVPDLLALLVRLLRDQRVPFLLKAQLLTASAYVISPFDFIPEGLIGVLGLADDLTLLALVMLWLKNVVKLDASILRDNWSREEDPVETIEMLRKKVVENADSMLGKRVWARLQSWFNKRFQNAPQPKPKGFRRFKRRRAAT